MKMTEQEVSKDELVTQLTELRKQYLVLMDLTAVDYETYLRILYFLHDPISMERRLVFVNIGYEEKIPSVTKLWEGAEWYERELYDMFGVHFEGHPDLRRILMPDDWVGHPMLKDFPLMEVPVQFKHDVKPKLPSEIIPHVKEKKY